MLKFNRNYKIIFEIGKRDFRSGAYFEPEEFLEVKYPFTLKLDINIVPISSITVGNFQIYNLSKTVQAKLWKDFYDLTKYVHMKVYAGYGENMPLIFVGDVQQCYSYRASGAVDVITDIQADSAIYLLQFGFSNATFTKGTEVKSLLGELLSDVPFLNLGYVSSELKKIESNQTYCGKTLELLKDEYRNYQIFVDKGELHVLSENDVVPSPLFSINSNSGLLGSPRRADTFLMADLIFEPQVTAGQAVELISDTLPFLNNLYKVVGVRHKGVISPVESGTLVTTVQLWLGSVFREVARNAEEKIVNTAFVPPTTGQITSPFGERIDPITKKPASFHQGVDIGNKEGTPIMATADGVVSTTGVQGGYGNMITIRHNNTLSSRYAHLSIINVTPQTKVKKGDVIGLMGSTGRSTGSHLHFEIRENGEAVNPSKYVASLGRG